MPREDDPETLQALRRLRAVAADPVRLDLLEVLRLEGPLTYSELARRVPSSRRGLKSHLRGLSDGEWIRCTGGEGRESVWAADPVGVRWSGSASDADPNIDQAVDDLWWGSMQRVIDRLQTWYRQREQGQWSVPWVTSSIQRDYSLWLTPNDLDELDDEIAEVLQRFRARSDANRERHHAGPPGSADPERPADPPPVAGADDELGAVFVTVAGFPLWLERPPA